MSERDKRADRENRSRHRPNGLGNGVGAFFDYENDEEPQRSRRDPRERTGMKASEPPLRQEVVRCHLCGFSMAADLEVRREQDCPNCAAALWCCRNCAFFDPKARYECHKPIPVRVKGKDKRNSCDLFKPRIVIDTSGRSLADAGGLLDKKVDEAGRKTLESFFLKD